MSDNTSDAGTFLKFMGGLGLGIAMTYAYTRYQWEMPAVVRLPAMVTSATISATADSDLYNWDLPFEARQRAAAVIIGQNPDKFIELDNATGHVLLNEMQRQRALRRAMIQKTAWTAFDVALGKPALRKALQRKYGGTDDEQLKRNMLAARIAEDEILDGFLRHHFPDLTRDDRVDLILDVGQNRLKTTPEQVTLEPSEPRL